MVSQVFLRGSYLGSRVCQPLHRNLNFCLKLLDSLMFPKTDFFLKDPENSQSFPEGFGGDKIIQYLKIQIKNK